MDSEIFQARRLKLAGGAVCGVLAISLSMSSLTPCLAQTNTPPVQYGAPAGNALDEPSSTPPATPPAQQVLTPPPQIQTTPNLFQQAPSQPPPIDNGSHLDLTSAILGRMELDLNGAQFLDAAVDKLHVVVNDLDMRNGSLNGLNIEARGGNFRDLAFDQLNINMQGSAAFDRDQLVNNRVLEFKQPVQAEILAAVSQDSLNKFLNSPGTLERLSGTANRKVSMLAGMLGSNAQVGITLSDASIALEKGNHVSIGMKASLGMGSMGLPLPFQLDTKLGLNDGWLQLTDTHLLSNGQEISPLLSNMLVKHINELTDWGKRNEDMHFSFSQLKVVPNKQFVVKGTAQILRLRFGQHVGAM